MKNPAFGSHLVFAYRNAGKPLPSEIGCPSLRRAYNCLKYEAETKRTDPAGHEALALGHPANRESQAIVKGFLCACSTYEEVGTRSGMSTEVARIFANLFCDFIERGEHQPFVRAALDPRSELGLFQPDLSDLARITDPALRLMNIGYWYGPETLANALGPSETKHDQSKELSPLQNAQHILLTLAGIKAKRGELTIESPEFIVLKARITAQAKHQASSAPMPEGPEAISLTMAWQSQFKDFAQNQLDEHLRATKEFQTGQAGESESPSDPKQTASSNPEPERLRPGS